MFATLLTLVVPLLYTTRRLLPESRQRCIVRQLAQGVYNP